MARRLKQPICRKGCALLPADGCEKIGGQRWLKLKPTISARRWRPRKAIRRKRRRSSASAARICTSVWRVRKQRSEIRGQRSEVRGQQQDESQNPTSDL